MEKRENAGHRAGKETILENCQNWCIIKLHIKEVSMKAKRKIVKITYTHYDGWKSKLDMILKAVRKKQTHYFKRATTRLTMWWHLSSSEMK